MRILWRSTPPLLTKGQRPLFLMTFVAHRLVRAAPNLLLFGPSSLSRLLRPLLTSAARSEWIAPLSVTISCHAPDFPWEVRSPSTHNRRIYLGRSAACHEIVTESGEIGRAHV